MKEYANYESYDFDRLTEGSQIKIEHTVYCKETDMSDLISKPLTELSPPIPKEYEKSFMVYGQLLPGYTTESMQKEQETKQEKRSVRKELASLKEQEKSTAPQKRSKTRSAPELG